MADGTVYRALEKLLVLDGERISYRALDVEQIGSVYETMMGFRLELARGRSLAIKAQSRFGAPTTVSLEELLEVSSGQRAKWLLDNAGRKLPAKAAAAVKDAATLEDLHAALAGVVDTWATPDLVAAGAMVLQPSEERRRSGSHYTPRSLTEPIVRTTLEPVLAALRGADGRPPRPEQILDLKVCDPAMGSGAFLVEVCRQLGDALVEAWAVHGGRPALPADEDERIFARRLVAQRCLYGVDRNAVAVDLAKMSLWLATLAREHPLTFLDHALRHGDSLVGLTRRQIEAFSWQAGRARLRGDPGRPGARATCASCDGRSVEAGEDVPDWRLRDMWDDAQHELSAVRLYGDLVVAAFFAGSKPAERETARALYADAVMNGAAAQYQSMLEELRERRRRSCRSTGKSSSQRYSTESVPGFDAITGNPPFGGKNTVGGSNRPGYLDWLKALHEGSHGNADLVAHFYRRAFGLLRPEGTFGLIATNTIGQGDTRSTGLRWILGHGGDIYAARKRIKWPGHAAVTVSVVHVHATVSTPGQRLLDGRPVEVITAYLFQQRK